MQKCTFRAIICYCTIIFKCVATDTLNYLLFNVGSHVASYFGAQNKDAFRRATYVGSFKFLSSRIMNVGRHFASLVNDIFWPLNTAVLAGCSAFLPVNCLFLQKNEFALHRWAALLLLIFILCFGVSSTKQDWMGSGRAIQMSVIREGNANVCNNLHISTAALNLQVSQQLLKMIVHIFSQTVLRSSLCLFQVFPFPWLFSR
jgi:hypothetical protein